LSNYGKANMLTSLQTNLSFEKHVCIPEIAVVIEISILGEFTNHYNDAEVLWWCSIWKQDAMKERYLGIRLQSDVDLLCALSSKKTTIDASNSICIMFIFTSTTVLFICVDHTYARTHARTHTRKRCESNRATSKRCTLRNAGGSVTFKPHNLRFT